MRRKILAGLMLLSMTASLFSNVGYASVNAAEYETNVNTATETAVTEDEVTVTEDVTTEAASTEAVSSEEILTEEPTVEEDNVDSIEEKLYDASKSVESGQYETWSWSLDEDGVLLVDGVITNLTGALFWPWYDSSSQIKTVKVTGSGVGSLAFMFNGCENLSSIDVSKFDTSNVTSMNDMFDNCKSIKSINVSKFNTSNVTSMSEMFRNCENLSSIDVSKFDTGNVTNMFGMFYNCKNLNSINVSNFDTSKVTSMSAMFNYCKSLTSIDVSNFDTSNVTSIGSMFYYCKNLKSIDVSRFDTSKVTQMDGMFHCCENLRSIDVSKFDTSNVTDMGGMFYGCTNLRSVEVSGFNTGNVTDMSYLFNDCENLSSIDVSKFDTSKVTQMAGMFNGCKNLRSIDVSRFDTSNVVNMRYMFYKCEGLSSIDVSNFNLSKVTASYAGSNMFGRCNSLTEIKSPYNIVLTVYLPTLTGYMWLDQDNNEVSVMRQNCSTSIVYRRSVEPTVCIVKFNGNGATSGKMSDYEILRSNLGTISANQYSKTGYIFTGWNTAADGSGDAFNDKEKESKLKSYVSGKDITVTLYAQWKPISYTIHFDKNTATSGSMKRVYPKYGRNYRLPACGFQKPGYTFAGWNTRKDGKGTTYKNQSNVKNLTTTNGKVVFLYAQWKKVSLSTAGKPTLGNYAAGRLTVTCKEVKGADGYLIQYSTNKNMKNAKIVSSITLKKNIYNLKKGTTYYVRVRAYKVDSAGKKVCGKYSAVQYKKITK